MCRTINAGWKQFCLIFIKKNSLLLSLLIFGGRVLLNSKANGGGGGHARGVFEKSTAKETYFG
jgi:hypothetical protein